MTCENVLPGSDEHKKMPMPQAVMNHQASGRYGKGVFLSRVRFYAAALVLLASRTVATAAPAGPFLAPDSPLATDGAHLFAVGANGTTLLMRPTSLHRGWEALSLDTTFGRIGGLAVGSDETLYVSDTERATLFRIDPKTRTQQIVHKGPPLRAPRELAAGDALFVADPGAEGVFRIGLESPARPIEPVKGLGERIRGDGSLAFWGGTLVYAEGMSISRLLRAVDPDGGKLEALQVEGDAKSRGSSEGTRASYKGHEGGTYPTIDLPVSVADYKGVVYAISGKTGLVYATPRLVRRAVNSTFGLRPGDHPSYRRIAVSDDWLFAVDSGGEVVRWPRPVPVEVTLESPLSECLSGFFSYLTKHDALPSRQVRLASSLEATLRDEGVLKYPYVTALDRVVCDLNPHLCTDGKPKPVLPAGAPLNVPDLFVESVLAYRPTLLDGKMSLGQLVDAALTTPEFAYARDESWLRRLNRIPETETDALRDRTRGEFLVPRELVRYVIAVPATDVRGGEVTGDLAALRRRCPGVTINPLERRDALSSGSGDCTADWTTVDSAHVTMLGAIHAATLPKMTRVEVAIVEDGVDKDHPDFSSTDGLLPFDAEAATAAPAVASPMPVPKTRCWDRSDHGTAVASLIGAQRWHQQAGTIAGIAPAAHLTFFSTDVGGLGHAISQSPVSAFLAVLNYSAETQSGNDDGFLSVLKQNGQTLFVVAAGNCRGDQPELCSVSSTLVYPACYSGDETVENLLVVSATTLDGKQWLDFDGTNEGANWSSRRVHVAAPGFGYWAEGNGCAYVPIRGTSFATPLVAATAARLAAAHISPPWRIKYRIIATADPVPGLGKKVMGGLLNVQRALTSLDQTLITRGPQTTLVFIDPGQMVNLTVNGTPRMIRLERILRLKKTETVYHIVYEDDSERLQVSHRAEVPANTPITVRPIDPTTGAVGAPQQASLGGIDDFVGPIPTWDHKTKDPA
jgi:hypothetical protein